MPLPAGASVWHANLPDISQHSVNAAAKAAAVASVGDKLVDSLQAQSLDLPPQAAKVTCLLLASCPLFNLWTHQINTRQSSCVQISSSGSRLQCMVCTELMPASIMLV